MPSLQEPTADIVSRWCSLPGTPVRSKYMKACSTNYTEDSFASAQVLSKELIVRRVFFDRRAKPGNHNNATVFLLEAKGTGLTATRFYGCRVGSCFSSKFNFRTPLNYQWVREHKNATSTLAIIECYNIPVVKDGDSASLYYNNSAGVVVEIQSQRALFVPKARAMGDDVSAVVCVGMIHAGAQSPSQYRMFYHWLHYQKTIGVDHVHMAVEDSFVRAGGLENEVIRKAVREGYLSIDFWPYWLNFTEIYNSQKLAYQDCLYRFQGAYDYVVYADSDDFFVPVKKDKSIKHYLKTWCSGKTASCCFTWRQFFPDCGWDPKSIGADGNFTAAITYKRTWDRTQTKSGHQLRALVDAGTHEAKILVKKYKQKQVPKKEAYFAHVRFGWLPKGGC